MLGSVTQQTVLVNTQNMLLGVRRAMENAADLAAWAAGVSVSDLEGIGFSSADAQAIMSAIADAGGMASIYNTGTDPRNPGPGYIYAASQRTVLGPQ